MGKNLGSSTMARREGGGSADHLLLICLHFSKEKGPKDIGRGERKVFFFVGKELRKNPSSSSPPTWRRLKEEEYREFSFPSRGKKKGKEKGGELPPLQ